MFDRAMNGHRIPPCELQAKAKALSAIENKMPPWTTPKPLSMFIFTRIRRI